MNDHKTHNAVIRNVEVIGEAAKNISASLKKLHPDIPWKDLAGMRDKMIHNYFGVNYEIVWTVATERLPDLLIRVKEILKRHSAE